MPEDKKIAVIPEQLVKARESLGLERDQVAHTLGISTEELHNWEKGTSEPNVEYLWNLAEIYQRSTDFFLSRATALPERLSFRLVGRKVIQDLPFAVRKVLVRFEELCRAEAELEEAMQRGRQIRIKPVANASDPQKLAEQERNRLGLGDQPIDDLRKLLSSQGVRIFMLPIPDIPANELSGLSWWHKSYGPCVLANSRNNPGRRVFTLAHEYAHLLLADPPTLCAFMLDIPEESFANRFAASFLMPANDLRKSFMELIGPLGEIPSDQDLGKLANRYRVSLEALARRLEAIEMIPRGFTNSRIAEWEKRPTYYRGKRGPLWRRQLGEEFVSLALQAHSTGLVSLSKLARYFGQDVRKATEIVAEERHG